ncbi:unnamed protein product [Macrosiphum euphorbiae]|uniref:MULE transposase domain-containing protein n=1 Tax=Macrosiphum euphorbiae TaxID=13131 RepID=A0AAV0XXI3_9HEMI|nr:unnamed protein product [Macrosiphum euphorbiae]
MYIERRKNLPPYPTSSEDAITKINEFQDADFLMFRGEKFVHLPEDSTFICLTTEKNLQSVKEVFPAVQIKTCRFHLGQAWWRKINGESKLRTAYNDKNNDLPIWLKSFFGLSFIAPDDVEDALVELISVCPNISVGRLFSDYVLETYIEQGCLFPPILWAETPSSNPRTTNGAESFHSTYNAQFNSAHPPIFFVIATLMETQAESVTKLLTISKGIIKPKSNKESRKIENLKNEHKHYVNNKTPENLLKYLAIVGNRNRGFKI